MSDIESLMYWFPTQGQPGFTELLSVREELWPTAYDVQRSAAQEVTTPVGERSVVDEKPLRVVSGASSVAVTRRSHRETVPPSLVSASSSSVAGGGEVSPTASRQEEPEREEGEIAGADITTLAPGRVDSLAMTDENIARHAVRVLCERFMLIYDHLFLYFSTGAGKTVISAGAAEPLVRNMATELVDSYLNPKRTNLRRVIVIVSSESNKRDFMKKIVETSRRPQYQRAVRIGATQPLLERMATYAAALTPTYVFHTKTSFITLMYGTGATHGDVDPTRPDPSGIAFANNSVILIDEIQSFSREESHTLSTAAARKLESAANADVEEGDIAGEDPAGDNAVNEEGLPISPSTSRRQREIKRDSRAEEDFRYAQYHFVLHTIQGSKIMVLSATPMKDSPFEIAKIMNLLLPLDRQIPAGLDVLSREQLMPYLRGLVSYFKTRSTRVVNRGVMFSLTKGLSGGGSYTAENLSVDSDSRRGAAPEFEVIFPVAMSPLQATVYRRVLTEKDSFNRNALRASNIVYPDGSSGHSGFIARFMKNTRGWDGMEPTEDFRIFLRASRENRETLSPKFCAIADLCRVSRGTVFVYMSNLEGGLYDLAAFLDAEGFDRFTPQQQVKDGGPISTLYLKRADGSNEMLIGRRPRYSLIIGETKTIPGRLEGIMDLANLDENADGEYVKVILGSAAIREAFDIRNSITLIIASPEPTKTAMIQARGRIIRPGAQRALFKRFPNLPPIASEYCFASYLPDTQYEGKDVDTYLDSARKDRKIKVVERSLRDAAVDCRMLHSLNYDEQDDVIDDSEACLYGPCDYVCDIQQGEGAGSSAGDAPLDSSSMNALYRGEKLIRLQSEIARVARLRVYIPFSDVDAVVESHALALRVVETQSLRKEQVKDRYGRQSYIYHDKNGVFFATSPVLTGMVGDGSGQMSPVSMSDYEHYITTSIVTQLDLLTSSAALLPGILETILIVTPTRAITESIDADHALLKKFALYIRREVVPKALILEHVRVRGEQRVHGLQGNYIYWVDYSGLLYTRGDLRVYEGDEGISALIDKTSSGIPLRILDTPVGGPASAIDEVAGTWSSPSPVLMRILHHRWRSYMRSLFEPFETRFAYYGVIKPLEPNMLRIARRGRDNAKTPGCALPSWSSEDLRDVIATILSEGSKSITQEVRREAAATMKRFASPREVNEYLTREFEKRGMLLRL